MGLVRVVAWSLVWRAARELAWLEQVGRVAATMILTATALVLSACGSGGDLGPDPGVAPSITVQPASITADDGTTATFTVTAAGEGITYQWRRNGNNITGATLAVYTTSTLALADSGGVYTVVVSNIAGSTTSNAATLTVVQAAARITTQPTDASVLDGSAATFAVVTAGGTPPITYQWFRNGTAISGATAASYTTPANAMADSGATYRVTISAAGGAVNSRNAQLTVTPRPPSITVQPAATANSQFQTSATFTAQADGTAPVSYQWYRNGVQLNGETGTTLTVSSVNYGDDGARYTLVARNGGGEVTSNASVLTVTPPSGTVQTISGCLTIGAPGAYRLGADISIGVSGATCLSIAPNTSNVQIDCAGRSVSATATNSVALALSQVSNVSVKGCAIQTSRLVFDRVQNVSFHDNSFPAGADLVSIEADHARLLAFDKNTIAQGSFSQRYGTAVTVSNNSFTAKAGQSALSAIIGSKYGSATRVLGNTLDGKWDTQRRGSSVQFGAHSGIDIEDESEVVIEGNTINYVFTCGVEFLGVVSGAKVRNNKIFEAAQCGFTAGEWASLTSSDYTGNEIKRSAIAFHFFRKGGLRPAGFDLPDRSKPADGPVTFRNIVIARNIASESVASDGGAQPPSVVVMPISERMSYAGPAGAGETEPSVFDLGNITFTRNTFDRAASAMELGRGPFPSGMVVDGGGNVCPRSSLAVFPIACN